MSKQELLQKIYSEGLDDKIKMLKAYAISQSNESFELHVNLGINPKISDQMFVHKCTLPQSTGKSIKILAFVPESLQNQASEADFLINEEYLDKIKKNKIFFDVCVATPEMMKMLSPLAKILGPRGLMPNAKLGTLTSNVAEAIQSLKRGQLSIKNDRYGILHIPIGKAEHSLSHLKENIEYMIEFISTRRPQSLKGNMILSVHLSTTMGPSVLLGSK
uniref:Ribosomal protein n=1 Tax=Andalucia godoyi TaxID=505711 RepID=M4Q973_ANDGO|nr:ribosomal protein L1 [Andalucia godoyi]AGH23967.1 ribosomal protein L1 [Andalucia godoyi]